MEKLKEIFRFYNTIKTGFSLNDLVHQLKEILGQVWGEEPLYFYDSTQNTFVHIAGSTLSAPEEYQKEFSVEFENIAVEKELGRQLLLVTNTNITESEKGVLFSLVEKSDADHEKWYIKKFEKLSAFMVKEAFSFALKRANLKNKYVIDMQKKMMNAVNFEYLGEELLLFLKEHFPDFEFRLVLLQNKEYVSFVNENGHFKILSDVSEDAARVKEAMDIETLDSNTMLFPCVNEGQNLGGIIIKSPYLNFMTPELRIFFNILANLVIQAYERIAYEQKLKQESELLKELIGFRKDITAMIAHDLSSPLMGIMGYMSILKNLPEKMPAMVIDYLNKSYRLTLRLNKLIEDFRMINQIDDNRLSLNFDKTPVDIFFREIFKFFKDLYPMELNYSNKDSIDFIRIDPHYFSRVIENIISNSIKYAGEDVQISVIVSRLKENRVLIEISDNGPGIPEEDLPLIFEKYKRSKTGRSVYGTGLGLYICKVVTDLHHGSISAENGVNGGVRFFITIPERQK